MMMVRKYLDETEFHDGIRHDIQSCAFNVEEQERFSRFSSILLYHYRHYDSEYFLGLQFLFRRLEKSGSALVHKLHDNLVA